MARTALTHSQRAASVRAAHASLNGAVSAALTASAQHGYDSPESIAAWETVEQYGATVHRQSRLLAGKSRGG